MDIPEGFALVPLEPTETQWGGLARAMVFWMRMYPSNRQTPATLIDFLHNYVDQMPAWMGDESELRTQDHVISKGTLAVLVYKAMIHDYRPEHPLQTFMRENGSQIAAETDRLMGDSPGRAGRIQDDREAVALQRYLLAHHGDVRPPEAGLMGWALAALIRRD